MGNEFSGHQRALHGQAVYRKLVSSGSIKQRPLHHRHRFGHGQLLHSRHLGIVPGMVKEFRIHWPGTNRRHREPLLLTFHPKCPGKAEHIRLAGCIHRESRLGRKSCRGSQHKDPTAHGHVRQAGVGHCRQCLTVHIDHGEHTLVGAAEKIADAAAACAVDQNPDPGILCGKKSHETLDALLLSQIHGQDPHGKGSLSLELPEQLFSSGNGPDLI